MRYRCVALRSANFGLVFTSLRERFLASIFWLPSSALYIIFATIHRIQNYFPKGGPIDGPPFSATISFLVIMRYRCVALRSFSAALSGLSHFARVFWFLAYFAVC